MIRLIIESLKGASQMINRQHIQLSLQSLSLVAGFMVWVLISSLISQITLDIHLSKGEISLVTAIPVILGSLLRIPLGYLTNRFGARLMFMISFILLLFPVFWISIADSLFDLIAGGFFLESGSGILHWGDIASEILSERKARCRQWDLWGWEHRNRHYHICGAGYRSSCGMESNRADVYGSAGSFRIAARIVRRPA